MSANADPVVPAVECNPIKMFSAAIIDPGLAHDGLARHHSARCHWDANPTGHQSHASEGPVNIGAYQLPMIGMHADEHIIGN